MIRLHTPVDPATDAIGNEVVPASAEQVLMHYAGSLSAAAGLFADTPFNTDDRPVIEYSAPVSHARTKAGTDQWFRGEPLARFYDLLLRITPPDEDPYLMNGGPEVPLLVQAGNQLHSERIYRQLRKKRAAKKAKTEYNRLVLKAQGLSKSRQE